MKYTAIYLLNETPERWPVVLEWFHGNGWHALLMGDSEYEDYRSDLSRSGTLARWHYPDAAAGADVIVQEIDLQQRDINELREQVRWYEKETARLQGIIAKLPTTADGVPVVPRMDVYWLSEWGVSRGTISAPCVYNDDAPFEMERCYSTKEAAEAAKEGGK